MVGEFNSILTPLLVLGGIHDFADSGLMTLTVGNSVESLHIQKVQKYGAAGKRGSSYKVIVSHTSCDLSSVVWCSIPVGHKVLCDYSKTFTLIPLLFIYITKR